MDDWKLGMCVLRASHALFARIRIEIHGRQGRVLESESARGNGVKLQAVNSEARMPNHQGGTQLIGCPASTEQGRTVEFTRIPEVHARYKGEKEERFFPSLNYRVRNFMFCSIYLYVFMADSKKSSRIKLCKRTSKQPESTSTLNRVAAYSSLIPPMPNPYLHSTYTSYRSELS